MSSSSVRSTSATRSGSGWAVRCRSAASSAASGGHPPVAVGRVGLRRPEVVQRLDQAGVRHHVPGAGRDLFAPGGQRPGPAAERGNVPAADPPPGAGEQPGQGRARGRVADHLQRADQVPDLRRGQQAAEPDQLDRHPARPQRAGDQVELRPAPAEHCDAAPAGPQPAVGRVLPPHRRHLVGQPVGLVGDGLQQGGPDHSRPAARPGRQRRDVLPDLRRQRVGDVEDLLVVAERGGQRQHRGRVAGRRTEVGGEPDQVVRARAAPAVDGLGRVADRGHRVAARRGPEQAAQHGQLRMPGVLVFVQQHGRIPGPLGPADLGEPVGDPGRDLHLVAEVDRPRVLLGPLVAVDQGQQRDPGGGPLQQPAHLRVRLAGHAAAGGAAPRLGHHPGAQVVGPAAQLVRLDEVLGQLAGQIEHPVGDRGLGVVQLRDVQVVRADHLLRQLPGHRLGQQADARLDAEPEGVLGDQAAGVRVVGGDGRFAGERGVAGRAAGAEERAQLGQPDPDPGGELAGGLGGERQAEDLVGADQLVGDEPEHPGRHRLGLAGAGAGDDDRRTQRRADHRGLLGGRHRQPQRQRQLLRRPPRRAHSVTWRPVSTRGAGRTGWRRCGRPGPAARGRPRRPCRSPRPGPGPRPSPGRSPRPAAAAPGSAPAPRSCRG